VNRWRQADISNTFFFLVGGRSSAGAVLGEGLAGLELKSFGLGARQVLTENASRRFSALPR